MWFSSNKWHRLCLRGFCCSYLLVWGFVCLFFLSFLKGVLEKTFILEGIRSLLFKKVILLNSFKLYLCLSLHFFWQRLTNNFLSLKICFCEFVLRPIPWGGLQILKLKKKLKNKKSNYVNLKIFYLGYRAKNIYRNWGQGKHHDIRPRFQLFIFLTKL